jgi:hypothetical protein
MSGQSLEKKWTGTQFVRLLKDLGVPVKIPEPVKEES